MDHKPPNLDLLCLKRKGRLIKNQIAFTGNIYIQELKLYPLPSFHSDKIFQFSARFTQVFCYFLFITLLKTWQRWALQSQEVNIAHVIFELIWPERSRLKIDTSCNLKMIELLLNSLKYFWLPASAHLLIFDLASHIFLSVHCNSTCFK